MAISVTALAAAFRGGARHGVVSVPAHAICLQVSDPIPRRSLPGVYTTSRAIDLLSASTACCSERSAGTRLDQQRSRC